MTFQSSKRLLVGLLVALGATLNAGAQELIPAAYTPAPYGVNFVGLSALSNRGDLAFDPSG